MTSGQKPQRRRQRQTPLSHNTYSIDFDDTSSHWPPIIVRSNETPTQRNERLEREREAKRINDEIDTQIEIEKSGRRRQDFKILLVGESLRVLSPTSFFIYKLFTTFPLLLYNTPFLGSLSHRPS
jgi:hypothetical protein